MVVETGKRTRKSAEKWERDEIKHHPRTNLLNIRKNPNKSEKRRKRK